MKKYKNKIILVVMIISLIANAYLFTRIRQALDYGYATGYKEGAIQGFEVGLNTGRDCITNGVKGECEGAVRVIGNKDFNFWTHEK